MRRFYLQRNIDSSGVSGTGQVAEGILFSTGKAVLGWTTKYKSVAVYDSIDELVAIHGHEGMTEVVFVDEEDDGLIKAGDVFELNDYGLGLQAAPPLEIIRVDESSLFVNLYGRETTANKEVILDMIKCGRLVRKVPE